MISLPCPGITLRIGGSRYRALATAVIGLAATLLLGALGPALPGLWPLLVQVGAPSLMGIVVAGGAGLLAWHVAGLTVAQPSLVRAALPATLVPLAICPWIGSLALVAPLLLAVAAAREDENQRVAAAMACCGSVLLLAGLGGGAILLLGAAWFSAIQPVFQAANDNPSLERVRDIWPLQHSANHAKSPRENPESGTWGVA